MYVFSPSIIVGDYEEIRIRVSGVAEETYVKLSNGTEAPLKIPSGTEDGIKVKTGPFSVNQQIIKLLLDFDPNNAVHQNGQGEWIMRPVIEGEVL